MTEHDIQNTIRLELSKLGWLTFRVNVGKVKMEDGRIFDTGLPHEVFRSDSLQGWNNDFH